MKEKIKLLWLSLCAPFKSIPHAGGKTLYYYFEKIKSTDRFDIIFVASCNESEKSKIESELEGTTHYIKYEQESFRGKLHRLCNVESRFNPWNRYGCFVPNSIVNYILRTCKTLKKQGYDPDIIVFDWTQILLLAPKVKKMFPKAKLVSDEVDVAFVGTERKYRFEKRPIYKGVRKLRYNKEKQCEIEGLKLCDLIKVQNPDNASLLISEGIEPNKITSLTPYFNNMNHMSWNPKSNDILFFGAMSRPENSLSCIWFIEKVMPRLQDLNVRFVILGNKPTLELKKYQSDKVIITGYVDSIEPYFENSLCFAAPLVLGAGIKVKIMEALSSGLPVLTNDIGIEGIPATDKKEYLCCTTPEEYEMAIRKIMEDKETAREIGMKAKALIQTTYSLDDSMKKLLNELETLVVK